MGTQGADADKASHAAEMKADQGDMVIKPLACPEKRGNPANRTRSCSPGKKRGAAQDMTKHFHPRDMK